MQYCGVDGNPGGDFGLLGELLGVELGDGEDLEDDDEELTSPWSKEDIFAPAMA